MPAAAVARMTVSSASADRSCARTASFLRITQEAAVMARASTSRTASASSGHQERWPIRRSWTAEIVGEMARVEEELGRK